MKRWLFGVSLVLLLLLAFVGYRGYVALGRLEARVAALEERLSAQEEALKTLGSRVADLEKEVLQAPAEPLALPQPPEAPAPPAWPYVLGALVVALLLYLLFRLLLPSRPASLKEGKGASFAEELQEEKRMEEEGAPPKPEDRS